MIYSSEFTCKTAIGCPDYDVPPHAWQQKENDSLTIGCKHSTDEWKMKCVDDIWLGIAGKCLPRT